MTGHVHESKPHDKEEEEETIEEGKEEEDEVEWRDQLPPNAIKTNEG